MKSMILVGRGAVIAASAVVAMAGSAHAASASLQGPVGSVVPGDVFSVSLTGKALEPIIGGGTSLEFAADLLELLSVEIDSAWDFVPDIGQRDNTLGKLTEMCRSTSSQACSPAAFRSRLSSSRPRHRA